MGQKGTGQGEGNVYSQERIGGVGTIIRCRSTEIVIGAMPVDKVCEQLTFRKPEPDKEPRREDLGLSVSLVRQDGMYDCSPEHTGLRHNRRWQKASRAFRGRIHGFAGEKSVNEQSCEQSRSKVKTHRSTRSDEPTWGTMH